MGLTGALLPYCPNPDPSDTPSLSIALLDPHRGSLPSLSLVLPPFTRSVPPRYPLQGMLSEPPGLPIKGDTEASAEPPDASSDEGDDINAYLCALAEAAMTGTAQPERGGGPPLAAEGENDLLQEQARDSPPGPPVVAVATVGSALPGSGGCHLAAEGDSGPAPTGPTAEAVMVGILPGCGGGHLSAEGGSDLLLEQSARRSPNGPMVCVSSGIGQPSSSAAAGSKQASSADAAAAGGGSSSDIATSSVLGLVMVLTPVDGSSCM